MMVKRFKCYHLIEFFFNCLWYIVYKIKWRKKEKNLYMFPPLNLYQNTCLWVCRQFERIGGHRQSLSPNNWFWFWPGPLAFSPFIKLRLAGKSWYHFAWSRGDSCLIIGARYFSVAAFSSFSVLLLYIHVKVSLLYLMQF